MKITQAIMLRLIWIAAYACTWTREFEEAIKFHRERTRGTAVSAFDLDTKRTLPRWS